MEGRFVLSLAPIALLAACGGVPANGWGVPATPVPLRSANPCGMPPPVPSPFLWLASPQSGSANVSTTIGILVFAGMPQGFYDTAKVTMLTPNGAQVAVGAYEAAPSPSPSPYPVPPGWSGNIPYVAAPVPTLAPSTTYTLSYTYTDFNGVPPACTGPQTLPLGSFTTQ